MDAIEILLIVVFGVVGLAVGCAYFYLMQYSLVRLTTRRAGALQFFAIAMVRVLLFGGFLVGAVLTGTWCLVSYIFAFVVARAFVVSAARRMPATPPGKEDKGDD